MNHWNKTIPTRKSTFSKYIEVPEHDQVTLMGFLNHGTKPPPHKSCDILNQAVFKIKTIPYINVSIWHDASLLSALFDAFIGFHCYFILIVWFNIRHELIIHINVIMDSMRNDKFLKIGTMWLYSWFRIKFIKRIFLP